MLNVISVKWGIKYPSSMVNRLFTMVDRNLTVPFTFYCYTDDPEGLDPRIQVIDIPEDNELEIYWNKLALHKPGMFTGTCLFFDLDVVIQNNIDHLLGYLSDKLTMVNSYWKGESFITDGSSKKPNHRWDMYANSSIMLWEAGKTENIWKEFDSNPDYYMIQYNGIDRFIFWNFAVDYFPEGHVYSRMCGYSLTNNNYKVLYKNQKKTVILDWDEFNLYYVPEASVCLFNGPTEDWMYDDFKHYWE